MKTLTASHYPRRASLSRLDDHMLKDIGLSRGSIEFAIREGR